MLKYPWPDMEPGDSILIEPPFTDSDSKKSPAGISAAMSGKRWLKLYRPEWYILCAREDDSIRIWVASTSVEEQGHLSTFNNLPGVEEDHP